MVHIHSHPNPFRLQLLTGVVSLFEGINGRSIVGIHGVQGLNGQTDTTGLSVGQNRTDTVQYLPAGLFQCLTRIGTTDQYDQRCSQSGCFVDYLLVFLDR